MFGNEELYRWKWQECSVNVSPSRASVVWKLRDCARMDTIRGYYLESQKFEFLNDTWSLTMYPHGYQEYPTAGKVLLYLQRASSTNESQKVKYRFFCRDKSMKEYHSTEGSVDFDEPLRIVIAREGRSTFGKSPQRLHRRDHIEMKALLDWELGELLLKEDTLTFCCEVKAPDAGEQEEAPSGLEGQTKCFKNHYKKLLGDLTTVYETAPFPDVILKVGEEEFPTHKAILFVRSSVFRAMFEADLKENRERVVNIQEMSAQTARAMLQYIYTGNVCDLENDSARDLYVAADRYELLELKAWCQQFISTNVSVDNVCQLALLADLHSDDALKTAARQFLGKNQQQVLQSDIWNEYATEKPAFFLKLISSVLLHRETSKS